MFPIVHYYVNLKTYGQVPPLMALGSLFPDLASGIGMKRDEAHQMGADFFRWCEQEAAQMLPLAQGIISHGVFPYGVDYYADEFWPGCEKGWCFEQGKPWLKRIAAATCLPNDLCWWKSHNFVEMSCELLTIEQYPFIGQNILAALYSDDILHSAAMELSRYTAKDVELIKKVFRKAPSIFSLEKVSPLALARSQDTAFRRRHNVYNADITGMASLLKDMAKALCPAYGPYIVKMTKLVSDMLKQYMANS
ncbi:MAG: hypothetical protein FWG61_00130 [Firmicutes bacterium]|nr:hypothetical protein [Bacillota bacterium]